MSVSQSCWQTDQPEDIRKRATLTYCSFVIAAAVTKPICNNQPMTEIGLRAKRSRPRNDMYLLRQPADHSRTMYSVPKNTTKTVSCGNRHIIVSFCTSIQLTPTCYMYFRYN